MDYLPVINTRNRSHTAKPARYKMKRQGIASRTASRDKRRSMAYFDTGHFWGWDK